jgi:hypothetical protein
MAAHSQQNINLLWILSILFLGNTREISFLKDFKIRAAQDSIFSLPIQAKSPKLVLESTLSLETSLQHKNIWIKIIIHALVNGCRPAINVNKQIFVFLQKSRKQNYLTAELIPQITTHHLCWIFDIFVHY